MNFKETEIGTIPEDWDLVNLEDITDVKGRIGWRGYTVDDLRQDGPLVLGAGQISMDNKIDLSKPIFISKEKYDESPEIKIERNDILVVKVGNTIGKVAIVNFDIGEACINPNAVLLKRIKCNPYYLYCFLTDSYAQAFLKNNSTASAQPALNQSTLKKLILPLPNKTEQNKIASIFSSFDEKIELNNRMNQTLEKIALAIFKHWFIDFEFPNDEGKPYNSSGGEMIDSELGEIPKGWEVGILDDEFKITMGQSPPGESYNKNGKGVIFFQGRSDFGFRFPSNRIYCTDPKRFANKFDTLVSVRAPVGDMNMSYDYCCIGRGLASVIHNNKYFSYTYYKLFSLTEEFRIFEGEGTVFGSINKNSFENINNLIPPEELIEQFENLINPIDELIYNNTMSNYTLSHLRDSLLPKLMSGKIRVRI